LIYSIEGHSIWTSYSWDTIEVGASDFPRLYKKTTTVTDYLADPYSYRTEYSYDSYLNVSGIHEYANASGTSVDDKHTYTTYTNYETPWILSKPTIITVKDYAGEIASRKWMDYNSSNGNLETEEVCIKNPILEPGSNCTSRNATQNAITDFTYTAEGNIETITDPNDHTTTFTYDTTKIYPFDVENALGHVTTTTYYT
jgi:YD repeat-containing protein